MVLGRSKMLFALSAAVMLSAAAQTSMAASYSYVTGSDLSSSRSSATNPLQITVGGDWTGFSISWVIAKSGNLWNYSYTISSDTPAMSHFIVSTSSLSTVINNLGGDDGNLDEIKAFTAGSSNPNLPGTLTGAKFNMSGNPSASQVKVNFSTTVAPVWGSFYAKGGSDSYAYNTGLLSGQFANGDLAFNKNFYVATPNTLTDPPRGDIPPVPLPAAAWGGLSMLAALGVGSKLRKKRLCD